MLETWAGALPWEVRYRMLCGYVFTVLRKDGAKKKSSTKSENNSVKLVYAEYLATSH